MRDLTRPVPLEREALGGSFWKWLEQEMIRNTMERKKENIFQLKILSLAPSEARNTQISFPKGSAVLPRPPVAPRGKQHVAAMS